ncbi:MAG: methyltransferase [Actinomycetaceae bacterium]|nr:methyltransferase [Actinomycetaceae bacterium]
MTEHYFSNSSAASTDDLKDVTVTIKGLTLPMKTADRVFSYGRLDTGTKVLLTEVEPRTHGRFLDLGCGWGPISVVLAHLRPEADVWAVDINSRALDLTKRNAHALACRNVRVFEADVALEHALKEGITFDEIWSNPPIRIGKKALRQMLTAWLALLAPDGVAWLVVARNLGADSLITWAKENGWDARKEHSKKGYRIISIRRTASSHTSESERPVASIH